MVIPVSLIGAFFIMYLAGYTINVLTLLAIVLAIGIVVDDAIVVMENIYVKVEQGMDPVEAGLKGSKEIYFAIIATTITLISVFFPIVFLQGITGRLFREFSIVMAGAVGISAFPAHCRSPLWYAPKYSGMRASTAGFTGRLSTFFQNLNDRLSETRLNFFLKSAGYHLLSW